MFFIKLYGSYTHRTGQFSSSLLSWYLEKKNVNAETSCVIYILMRTMPHYDDKRSHLALSNALKMSCAFVSIIFNNSLILFQSFTKQRNPHKASVDSVAIYALGRAASSIWNRGWTYAEKWRITKMCLSKL